MKIKLDICKKICNECPFKIGAVKGYIDYHTPEEILEKMQFEFPFSCHLQRGDDPDENMRKIHSGEQQVCRGFVATADKSCKLFGQNPIYGKELRRLQDTITEEDLKQVYSKWDWLKYHEFY